jgi:hypothetical protein
LKKFNKELIIGGCLWDIDKERIENVFNGKYFTLRNMDALDGIFPEFDCKFNTIPDANENYDKFFHLPLILYLSLKGPHSF